MANIPTHKVFVSFHHEDESYKEAFCRYIGSDIVDKSVDDGDVNPNFQRVDGLTRGCHGQ